MSALVFIRPRTHALFFLLAFLGCSSGDPSMVLLSELPEDIERFAVLRWDEQRVLIGATGLLPIDQPALQLTDEDPAFVSLAGFSRIQLETMRLPELATLEAAPLRLAGANDERLPTPAIYLDGPVGPGLVDLEATPAPALSAGWVESACPRTTPERPERLSASGHILGLLGLDARSALAVVNERARTMLFRADIELTEALHPPGFDDAGGPGTWRTSAAHFENGVLYLVPWKWILYEKSRCRDLRGAWRRAGVQRLSWWFPMSSESSCFA